MATLFRRSRALCQCQRSFSTSAPRAVSLQWEKNDPEALAEVLPPYPYGPTRWYKQSRLGLYGGQRIQFGNNVSGPFKAKTRRTWHPNIFTRKLFSKSLNRNVQVRVSARVLRTIDKLGGLDEYLLGEKPARIKELGESGWWLRWAIMQTPAIKTRFAEERIRLGLPEKKDETEFSTGAIEEPEEALLEEDESLTEDMETVPMDDAFQIEQDESLPPIKFRVGRGQHIMLTANGWTRTRPSPSYFSDKKKLRLAEQKFPNFIENGLEMFEKELDKQLGLERKAYVQNGLKLFEATYEQSKQSKREASVNKGLELFEEKFDERKQLEGQNTKETAQNLDEERLAERKRLEDEESQLNLRNSKAAARQHRERREEKMQQLEGEALVKVGPDANERAQLLKEVRRSLKQELQEKVDELFEKRQTLKDERTMQRWALKQEKKLAARAEQDAALELA